MRFSPQAVHVGDVPTHFEVWKTPNRESGCGWQPVVVFEEVARSLERSGRDPPVPLGPYGARLLAADDMFKEFHQIQGETHTGHHHRNKNIKVPTAAGEPVRA